MVHNGSGTKHVATGAAKQRALEYDRVEPPRSAVSCVPTAGERPAAEHSAAVAAKRAAAASDLIPSRTALIGLFGYRLGLAAVLLLLFSSPRAVPWLEPGADAHTANALLAIQLLSVAISGLFIALNWPPRPRQVELAVFCDLGLYTLLMHVSGGVNTGLGLILAIVVAAGATLMHGRLSLLFASLATLAVMAEQFYADLYQDSPAGSYTQAGLLGLTYFAVALLAHVLARRLRETERLAARRTVDLADLAQLNDNIIQSLTIGVLAIDGERRLVVLNNAARRLLGVPAAQPGDALTALAPALADWLGAVVRGTAEPDGPVLSFGTQEVRPSLHLLGLKRANGALIFLRDQRELTRQAQEMKLASLGRLTASIAHNIRNPLSAVTHASQLLAESPTLGEEERHLLAVIQRNALRIDETVSSVLELSRRDRPQPERLLLNQWLSEFCAEYCASHHRERSALRLQLPRERLTIAVDPRHLGQILRNLCDNAFTHGQRVATAPRVTVRLARVPGGVAISVIDDGPGVAAEHVRDLFDPFFTTSSRGTGLGLYAARELAEANGLRLEYIAARERGAEFRLFAAAG